MLYTTETITVARCNGLTWTTQTVSGCSWYEKAVGSMQDKGLQYGREIRVRIPADRALDFVPVVGDYIIKGTLQAPVTKIGDLSAYCFCKCMTVGDNRRGRLPHWLLVGA